ncbi:ABC transporter ATP-binding protein [Mariniflexile litorale]|uniref:ABC transporter ATP-binding protein n=1 Tax=Mariniflexile litorale TaxID=3045158 RepID=A0AAU7EJP5_9FLAO|nr:ABC transporter ATP-binding protein [Mariniflexile sp. KMM 9835]MDQ8210958.1 ABC transporter ATP-binding protein [Mariniflexile sp. KMM 9835]
MIQSKNISYSYSKKKSLFKDLTFQQNEGSIVGLLGKNGAGKSTLLNLISGLLRPKKGDIEVNGYVPFKRNPNFLSDIYLVTDELFLPSLTINAYMQAFVPLYKNFDIEKMRAIMLEFELDEKDKLNKLSHGQQKKFIIAFALATNCKILLLDEPTNGLDIPSKRVFRKILVSSIEENQLVIISTHQVKDIETIIDRIVVLEQGHIVFEKDITQITEKIQFKKVSSILSFSNVLYHEKCPEGYNVMLPVENDEETGIDIELLFNAITNKTEIIF